MLNILIIFIGIVACIDPLKKSESSLHLLQLEGYNLSKYSAWLSRNRDKLLSVGALVRSEKSPLVLTDRAKRLKSMHLLVNMLIYGVIFILSLAFSNLIITFIVIVFSILLYFLEPYIMSLSAKLVYPREKAINQGFYTSAQKKIGEMKDLRIIGITGSYGKTSTKFITSTILKIKYQVQDTPSSYNTPMGLSKVINNELTEDKEVFVAEMGAYTLGEIKEVADLVQPQIGILTSIGPAHLESFGSIENIIKTKYELIEALPQDGKAIFNYDDPNLKEVANKTKLKKYYYGLKDIDKLDVYATDISVNSRGSEFKLVVKGLGDITCQTKMLGRHNISNILAGCTVGYILGLSLEEIARGVSNIEPVDHRLNLIDSGNGVIVIDDGFNSNPAGARAALEVLSEFKEGNKIIVTPGMIELGDLEDIENKKFGNEISKVADFVFLIGKKRTKPILEGLLEMDFTENNIFVVDSLAEATEIFGKMIKPGDVILFENDLPDNYSEEDF